MSVIFVQSFQMSKEIESEKESEKSIPSHPPAPTPSHHHRHTHLNSRPRPSFSISREDTTSMTAEEPSRRGGKREVSKGSELGFAHIYPPLGHPGLIADADTAILGVGGKRANGLTTQKPHPEKY
jgi:hypothetical protein